MAGRVLNHDKGNRLTKIAYANGTSVTYTFDPDSSDAGKDIGTNSSHVECYKKFAFCFQAEAYSFGGQAWVNTTTLDILRWDEQELIAIDSTPTCQVNQIRFDFKTKQVSVTESPKGDTKDPFCKDVKATTAYLGGVKDEIRRIDKETKK